MSNYTELSKTLQLHENDVCPADCWVCDLDRQVDHRTEMLKAERRATRALRWKYWGLLAFSPVFWGLVALGAYWVLAN